MSRLTDIRKTIRFSPEEIALIEEKADNRPISAFIREATLKAAARKRRVAQRAPGANAKFLAQILAVSMQHPKIAEFKRAAEDAETTLNPQEDIHATIRSYRELLTEIRDMLMDALRRSS